MAAREGHNHIAEYLVVEKKADINTKDNKNGVSNNYVVSPGMVVT